MAGRPICFAVEPLTDAFLAECMPLLRSHWREIAHYPDIELDPDLGVYRASAEAGILRVFTARRETNVRQGPIGMPGSPPIKSRVEDVLVGYAIFFVRPNPHYRGSVQAVQDVLYVSPEQRGGTGYRFIAWCDLQLRAEGAQAVYHHVKAAHDFGVMLERQGYELVDKIYAKRLDQEAE